MIVELKSLLPLIYGTNQEQTLSVMPGELKTGREISLPVSDVSALFPAYPGNISLPLSERMPPGTNEENSSASLEESCSRLADLLAQLLSSSERSADASNRIVDLLEQQNSETNMLYN